MTRRTGNQGFRRGRRLWLVALGAGGITAATTAIVSPLAPETTTQAVVTAMMTMSIGVLSRVARRGSRSKEIDE